MDTDESPRRASLMGPTHEWHKTEVSDTVTCRSTNSDDGPIKSPIEHGRQLCPRTWLVLIGETYGVESNVFF